MSKLKAAVVGVGHIGRHHARLYADIPDVELIAVVDANETQAQQVAKACRATALSDCSAIVSKVDLVSIAVPTALHARMARPFLERGVATLIEKPLAFSCEEADAIVRWAQRSRAKVQVGHIERFNPTWSAFERERFRPMAIQATRFSPYPFRSLDVSVVFDVMIHDLDLAVAAMDSEVIDVQASGARVLSGSLDVAIVALRFSSGAQATLSASRIHHASARIMRLWAHDRTLELDFLNRVSVSSRRHGPAVSHVGPPVATAEEREAILRQRLPVERVEHDRSLEPLRLELESFVCCVRDGARPQSTAEEGARLVRIATAIERAIDAGEESVRAAA